MGSSKRIRRRDFAKLFVIVCLVAAIVGCILGGLAGLAYGYQFKGPVARFDRVDSTVLHAGLWLGAVNGLLVGAGWGWVMVTRAIRDPLGSIVGAGAWNGLTFSVLAALIIHTELILTIVLVTFGHMDRTASLIAAGGLGCSIVVGLLVGGLGGRGCRSIVRAALAST